MESIRKCCFVLVFVLLISFGYHAPVSSRETMIHHVSDINVATLPLLELLGVHQVTVLIPNSNIQEIELWIDLYEKNNLNPIQTILLGEFGSTESIDGQLILIVGFDTPPITGENEMFIAWGIERSDGRLSVIRDTLDLSTYIETTISRIRTVRTPTTLNMGPENPVSIYQVRWGRLVSDVDYQDIDALVKHHDLLLSFNLLYTDKSNSD